MAGVGAGTGGRQAAWSLPCPLQRAVSPVVAYPLCGLSCAPAAALLLAQGRQQPSFSFVPEPREKTLSWIRVNTVFTILHFSVL